MVEIFFQWNAPDGPSTFFGPGVMLFDFIRIVTLLLCLMILLFSIGAASKGHILGQKARLVGASAIFVLYVGGTELEHLGDYAHWRLYVGFFCSVVYTWGLWSFYRFEKPSEFREPPERK